MASAAEITRSAHRRRLPARAAAGPPGETPAVRQPRRAVPAATALVGLVVLVVEDDVDSRDLVRQVLEATGARVLLAADGEEALRVLAGEKPHVVLCDLRMPGMDGFELIRRRGARPAYARLRVPALTALNRHQDYLQTLVAGFDGHLAKPVEWEHLIGILESERRQVHRKPRPRSPQSAGRVRSETRR